MFNIDFSTYTFGELISAYEHYSELSQRSRERWEQYKQSPYADSAYNDVIKAEQLRDDCFAEMNKRQN